MLNNVQDDGFVMGSDHLKSWNDYSIYHILIFHPMATLPQQAFFLVLVLTMKRIGIRENLLETNHVLMH